VVLHCSGAHADKEICECYESPDQYSILSRDMKLLSSLTVFLARFSRCHSNLYNYLMYFRIVRIRHG
jgi:hypothetical protein